jgi:hypothetical protein
MENKEDIVETVEDTPIEIKKKKHLKDKNVEIKEFKDLENKFLLVRVGTPESPASSEQIKEIETKLVDLFEKNNINCLAFVTHHAIDIQIIEKNL